jgi:hypothetical protein
MKRTSIRRFGWLAFGFFLVKGFAWIALAIGGALSIT